MSETVTVENGIWSEKTKAGDERRISCNGCGEMLALHAKWGPKRKRTSKEGGQYVKTVVNYFQQNRSSTNIVWFI